MNKSDADRIDKLIAAVNRLALAAEKLVEVQEKSAKYLDELGLEVGELKLVMDGKH